MDEKLIAVRTLHIPTPYGSCQECINDYGEQWPCATAKLVYTEDEIATNLYDLKQLEEQRKLIRKDQPLSLLDNVMREIYGERLIRQLEEGLTFTRKFNNEG